MNADIPHALKVEHEELHAELVRATTAGGRIEEAARAVAKLLHPHFVKEEAYALPPLGLLARVAAGDLSPALADILPMTERLKTELRDMLDEHRAIVAALERLAEVAVQEGKPEYARFAEKLKLHAQTEEEVLYPAAIVLGEYVKATCTT
jgi:iron-sulfur cluster repair protein YtfE (RIC family)